MNVTIPFDSGICYKKSIEPKNRVCVVRTVRGVYSYQINMCRFSSHIIAPQLAVVRSTKMVTVGPCLVLDCVYMRNTKTTEFVYDSALAIGHISYKYIKMIWWNYYLRLGKYENCVAYVAGRTNHICTIHQQQTHERAAWTIVHACERKTEHGKFIHVYIHVPGRGIHCAAAAAIHIIHDTFVHPNICGCFYAASAQKHLHHTVQCRKGGPNAEQCLVLMVTAKRTARSTVCKTMFSHSMRESLAQLEITSRVDERTQHKYLWESNKRIWKHIHWRQSILLVLSLPLPCLSPVSNVQIQRYIYSVLVRKDGIVESDGGRRTGYHII